MLVTWIENILALTPGVKAICKLIDVQGVVLFHVCIAIERHKLRPY